jgi:hypothetical protein
VEDDLLSQLVVVGHVVTNTADCCASVINMKTNDLIRLGLTGGEATLLAHEFIRAFIAQGNDAAQLEMEIASIVANPAAFFEDELRAALARALYRPAFIPRKEPAPWHKWGEGLEAEALKQMSNACALPIAVAGALMPRCPRGVWLADRRGAGDRQCRHPLRCRRGYRVPNETHRL